MDRVLSSPGRQKALVRLMSSDPSLLSGLEDELLASITLLSAPPADRRRRSSRERSARATETQERKNIQLYSEGEAFAMKEEDKMEDATRATTVLLSPCSKAAAVAATASTKQDVRCAASAAAPTTRCTLKTSASGISPIVLLDETTLSQVGGRSTACLTVSGRSGSVQKKSKKNKRRGRKKNSTSSSGSSCSGDDRFQRRLPESSKMRRGVASSMVLKGKQGFASDSDEGPPILNSRVTMSTIVRAGKSETTSRILLDHHHFVSRDQWIPPSARKSCYVCMRDFRVLRKRHSCRMCGEVICSRCSVFREVNLPVMVSKFRICSCCFVSYRKKTEKQGQDEETDASDHAGRDSAGRGKMVDAFTSDVNLHSEPSSLPYSPVDDSIPLLQALPSNSRPGSISDQSSSSRNTMNTMSDLSFSSDTTCDLSNFSAFRSTEDELEAVLKAKELEKEVEASQRRIEMLEAHIANQESRQDILSTEQQVQLQDARATIKILQEQLRMQELNARQAAYNRDSICLSKLRQTELYTNEEDESAALKKKLKVLERQLKQAGISVAEVIPYDVAKRKVEEISRRLQEIGSSEVVMENKQAQAAARKEYYILEQEMEKYHMALVMTDEYIEEQRQIELEWEEKHRSANLQAARLLRSAMPVNISRLSERDLIELATPTGAAFPAELARRLKRTNVLQLLRTDPRTIVKMHPSVIEGYRTTGLTLLERRALHHVMLQPFQEWKKQQKDELSQKKYAWYCKLKDAFATAATNFRNHCESNGSAETDDHNITSLQEQHSCSLLGQACPVRAEGRVRKLYTGLGFTPDADYMKEDILKGDPECAGEKALLEAQAHAREMVANQRQRDLKAHYKMQMREVAQAAGALEEMDTILDRVRELDDAFPFTLPSHPSQDDTLGLHERKQLTQCNSLLSCTRELALLLAKRAGICLTGKRDPANDDQDSRSPIEVVEASYAITFLHQILTDISALLFDNGDGTKFAQALSVFKAIQELLSDVHQKNLKASGGSHEQPFRKAATTTNQRVPWQERPHPVDELGENDHISKGSHPVHNAPREKPSAPTSALLFDAIKARRKKADQSAATTDHDVAKIVSNSAKAPNTSKPMDLMAAIRARRRALSNHSIEGTQSA